MLIFFIKKSFIYLIAVFSFYTAYAQQHIIKDINTKEPLAFANVVFDDKDGVYSNENGVFFLNNEAKTVQVSYLGYEDFYSETKDLDSIILLTPRAFEIEEIIISNQKKSLQKIGFLKNKGLLNLKNLPLGPKAEIIIVIIPSASITNSYIEKIEFPLDKIKHHNRDDKFYKNVPAVARINIYTTKNNFPKQKIYSSEPLKFIMSDKEKISIDISDQNIQFTENGLSIGIEMIGRVNDKGEFVEEKSQIRPRLTNIKTKDYQATTYLSDPISKETNEYYPINSINEHWTRDVNNSKPQDYNLAIGLTVSK